MDFIYQKYIVGRKLIGFRPYIKITLAMQLEFFWQENIKIRAHTIRPVICSCFNFTVIVGAGGISGICLQAYAKFLFLFLVKIKAACVAAAVGNVK